jgi:hypothetical protein
MHETTFLESSMLMGVTLPPYMQLLMDQSGDIELANETEMDTFWLSAIIEGLNTMCDIGKAKIINGSEQPNATQTLAAPGTDGNGHKIREAFIKSGNKLMLELKMQCRPSFAKKEKWPLMVTTVSDPASAAFGNIAMPLGSLSTWILTAICNDPSSNVTKVDKTPAVLNVKVQMPELEEEIRHSNVEIEADVEHEHEPWKFSPKNATLNNLFANTEIFSDENKTEGRLRIKIWVDMSTAEDKGLVFTMASFLEEKTSPNGINEDQSIPLKSQSTVVEFMKDADALNNPSSREQYTGKLELQVELT